MATQTSSSASSRSIAASRPLATSRVDGVAGLRAVQRDERDAPVRRVRDDLRHPADCTERVRPPRIRVLVVHPSASRRGPRALRHSDAGNTRVVRTRGSAPRLRPSGSSASVRLGGVGSGRRAGRPRSPAIGSGGTSGGSLGAAAARARVGGGLRLGAARLRRGLGRCGVARSAARRSTGSGSAAASGSALGAAGPSAAVASGSERLRRRLGGRLARRLGSARARGGRARRRLGGCRRAPRRPPRRPAWAPRRAPSRRPAPARPPGRSAPRRCRAPPRRRASRRPARRRGRGSRSGRAACFLGASGDGSSAAAASGSARSAAPRRRTARRPGGAAGRGASRSPAGRRTWPPAGAVGATSVRTGENAAASRTAAQRSGPSIGCSDAVVASASRVARAPGNGTPAFGGCDDRRRARTTRPTSSAASTSASQSASSSLLLGDERRLELGGQLAGRLVAGDERVVGRGDDAAQVAQVEVLELALGGLGAVEPVGDAQAGEQLLGHLHDGRLRHLRLALGLQAGVVLAQPLAHGGHALQRELGDRPLLLGRRRQHVRAVLLAGTQALRLRTLRQLGRRREVRPLAPPVVAARAVGRDVGRRRSRSPVRRPLAGPPRGRRLAAARRRAAARSPPVATIAVGTVAGAGAAGRRRVAPGARCCDDGLERHVARAAARACRHARPSPSAATTDRTRDAVDVVLGLDPQLDRRPSSRPAGSTRRGRHAARGPRRRATSTSRRGTSWSARSRCGSDIGVPPYRVAPRRLQCGAERSAGDAVAAGTVGAVPIYALGDQVPTIDADGVRPSRRRRHRLGDDRRRRARCGRAPCCAATTARSASAPARASRTAPCAAHDGRGPDRSSATSA